MSGQKPKSAARGSAPGALARWIAYPPYLVLRLLIVVLAALPDSIGYRAVEWLGVLGYFLLPGRRKVTLSNARRALSGHHSEREIRRIVMRSYGSFFKLGLDLQRLPRALERGLEKYVAYDLQVPIEEHRGEPVVMVTGHLGSLEIAGQSVHSLGFPTHSVMNPPNNPWIAAWLARSRSSPHMKVLMRKGAMRQAIKVLDEGESVAILIDQNQRKKGVFVPFFGHPASTVRSPVMLASRAQCWTALGWAERIGVGFRFCFHMVSLLPPPDPEMDNEERTRLRMEELTAVLEREILKVPDQYFWLHNRWKTQPKPEAGATLS